MLRINRWFVYAALTLGAIGMALPFYWMVTASFKTIPEALRFPPTLWPAQPTVENYAAVFRQAPFARYALNSVIVSVATTLAVVFTSSLAGYGFAAIRFRGKQLLFMLVLATMMVPPEVRIIPNFVMINSFGWTNSYQALVIPFAANVFSIFLMRQAFMSIPVELYDAALLDGATHWQYFRRIASPLTRSSLAVVGLLAFLRSWNELLWPLIVTSSQDMRTLQLGLNGLVAEISLQFPVLLAAATMTVLPILFLYLMAQNEFVEGIASTGLK